MINRIIDRLEKSSAYYNGTQFGEGIDLGIRVVKEESKNNGWIPCSERLPDCEVEVYIQTECGIVATAMYEDGKMSNDNSAWNWNDIDFDYDEETDTNFIPEGWWEYKHFNPDYVYNYEIDEKVIAWQPLPEMYKTE